MRRTTLIICLILSVCLLTSVSAAKYEIRDLGPAKGHVFAKACALSEDGRVAGQSGPHIVVWQPGRGAECLGVSPEERSDEILSVNSSGVMVGKRSYSDSGIQKAMLWDANGKPVELRGFGGKLNEANAINDAGMVVGSASDVQGTTYAFLWKPDGEMVKLDTLKDGRSGAYDINKSGQIAGYSENLAVLWEADGSVQELGNLSGYRSSTAFGLNNSGVVVGSSVDSLGKSRAFMWTQEGGMKELAMLPGWTEASAEDVNDAGVVVGWARNDKGICRAVAWEASGNMTDLGVLGQGECSKAYRINNAGKIVGQAKDKDGKSHAVIWE